MKIEINGEAYDVPESYIQKIANDLWAIIEKMYAEKLDDTTKSGLMLITRAFLVREELSIREKHGKEAARAIRPPAKADPNLWLAKMLMPTVQRMLNDVSITCQTESSTITAFALSIPNPSAARGQMDSSRNERLRENNGSQIS